MRKIIVLCTLIGLTFYSCKKDSNAVDSQMSLLTSKPWKPALIDKNSSTNPKGNIIYHATLNCEKDDNYLFSSNNILKINRGQLKCENDVISADISDYGIDLTKQKITINGIEFILAEVSLTQLKYYSSTPSVSGYENIIYLFEH